MTMNEFERAYTQVCLRDPGKRAEMRAAAKQRHFSYLVWLAAQQLVTVEELKLIAQDHLRMIEWFYNKGGWRS